MNTFVDSLKRANNITITENGAVAHKTTFRKVYDMFAFAGAYRTRTDEDCILLFKNALEEDATLALKCLFYIRDIRGGQGERRFFRVCFQWLAQEYPELARRNLIHLAEYGRYDDLYCVVGTVIENDMFEIIKNQLRIDLDSLKAGANTSVSLLAKWLKSENASSYETKQLANRTREYLGLTHKAYRQILSALRTRINIVEKLMSENRWEEIEFDKIPSKAGLIYRNAFAHRDVIAAKYAKFMADKNTKINTGALYPYEIVRSVTEKFPRWADHVVLSDIMEKEERDMLNKAWAQQKDYINGAVCPAMAIVDTSGSMRGLPLDVAISLGMYSAERLGGPFKNSFISFSAVPRFVEVEGVDFVDKVRRIWESNVCENTNLTAVFDLLRNCALDPSIDNNDLPKTLVVISDMEIDRQSCWRSDDIRMTEMQRIRSQWNALGLEMPHLVYWNVNARHNVILDDDENTTFVSGCSPVIFESIISGKSGQDLMMDKLNSERYDRIK